MGRSHTRSNPRIAAARTILRTGRRGRDGGPTDADEGFTLIELMVVLLIMAILLAIAIPTFLGVTSGAKVTAAQSNLANAVITAKTIFSKTGSYPTSSATFLADLDKVDPSIDFTTGFAQKGSNSVSFGVAIQVRTDVGFAALDGNTDCWIANDNESTRPLTTASTTITLPPGTSYAWVHTATCKVSKALFKVPGPYVTGVHNSTTWQPNFKTLSRTST
jgi:type IV pilus assembly protein PilA